tara:strand:- start:284 stop:703 length:420 start_codon:yes stop_codon:yes gene_type:complete
MDKKELDGEEAVKADDGKIRMDLFPPDALLEIGKVYTMGAIKYAPRNWEKGTAWSRCTAALLRHFMTWMGGENMDPESKLPHLAHVAWNAICLLTYQIRDVGNDDRFKIRSKNTIINKLFPKGSPTEEERNDIKDHRDL